MPIYLHGSRFPLPNPTILLQGLLKLPVRGISQLIPHVLEIGTHAKVRAKSTVSICFLCTRGGQKVAGRGLWRTMEGGIGLPYLSLTSKNPFAASLAFCNASSFVSPSTCRPGRSGQYAWNPSSSGSMMTGISKTVSSWYMALASIHIVGGHNHTKSANNLQCVHTHMIP